MCMHAQNMGEGMCMGACVLYVTCGLGVCLRINLELQVTYLFLSLVSIRTCTGYV